MLTRPLTDDDIKEFHACQYFYKLMFNRYNEAPDEEHAHNARKYCCSEPHLLAERIVRENISPDDVDLNNTHHQELLSLTLYKLLDDTRKVI